MATELIMPKVDMVMEEGTFVEWLKQEGDQVNKGEPLFVILTDKANIEIEAPASGVLAGLSAKPDDIIPVTQVIGYVLAEGEALPDLDAPVARVAEPSEAVSVVPSSPSAVAVPEPVQQTSVFKARATPVARRLAAEHGVDLSSLVGRGPQGRIHKADVLALLDRRRSTAKPSVVAGEIHVPLPQAARNSTLPLSGPRRIIAERMSHSAFTAPHITLSLRVDMSEAIQLRQSLLEPLQQKTGHRLSHTAILARAVAQVLANHPLLNASLDGDQIVLWQDIHLGIATSVDDYLIVPVMKDAQNLTLEQMVETLADLTARARSKRLKPTEMAGSTFTISNLGMFGIESFNAIINPPEAAILAVGSIVDSTVVRDGRISIRPLMDLTLSADHRIVDGVAAARFLADVKRMLENPYLLLWSPD
jgi:pyruvate dehydrogenase E2 component (dihydrolipoamide acetyltransferase)